VIIEEGAVDAAYGVLLVAFCFFFAVVIGELGQDDVKLLDEITFFPIFVTFI